MITSEQKNQIEVLEQSGSPAPAARVVPSEQLWLRSYRGEGGAGAAAIPRPSNGPSCWLPYPYGSLMGLGSGELGIWEWEGQMGHWAVRLGVACGLLSVRRELQRENSEES